VLEDLDLTYNLFLFISTSQVVFITTEGSTGFFSCLLESRVGQEKSKCTSSYISFRLHLYIRLYHRLLRRTTFDNHLLEIVHKLCLVGEMFAPGVPPIIMNGKQSYVIYSCDKGGNKVQDLQVGATKIMRGNDNNSFVNDKSSLFHHPLSTIFPSSCPPSSQSKTLLLKFVTNKLPRIDAKGPISLQGYLVITAYSSRARY
jgi:hypothetical protein